MPALSAPDGILADRLAIPTYEPFTWHSEPPRAALRWVRAHLRPLVKRLPAHPITTVMAAAGCDELLVISRRRDRELPEAVWEAARTHLDDRLVAAAAATRRAATRRGCVHMLHADAMGLADQLALFGGTTVRALIGTHGANLVNMIWCSAPLAVVEVTLGDARRHFSNYWHMAHALGFEHWLLHVAPEATLESERLWRIIDLASAPGGAG